MDKTRIVWTEALLKLTPAQELQIACSDNFSAPAKSAAFSRYSAKRWYETVVLAPRVLLDLHDLAPADAVEVVELRRLVGLTPPWLLKELAA